MLPILCIVGPSKVGKTELIEKLPNPFLKSLFSKTLEAMVSTLKGVKQAKNIDLSIRREKE